MYISKCMLVLNGWDLSKYHLFGIKQAHDCIQCIHQEHVPLRSIKWTTPHSHTIQGKGDNKGIDKYDELFVIWLPIDRLLPTCKLSMKTWANEYFNQWFIRSQRLRKFKILNKNLCILHMTFNLIWENQKAVFFRFNCFIVYYWGMSKSVAALNLHFSIKVVEIWPPRTKVGIFVSYHYFTFLL